MVKIDKLTMHGFKSFNKKTVLPLFEGFNAVIGPNGSGKSNVIDSLCFVLGRASRSLRAGRMDHIIFNGGHGRKASDFAFVSLHLENKDKIIPNVGEELEITRRVNRRGNSTYRINGKVVNRSKILEVLRYARIDPDGHNIIQQGDITKVIEMKARERRGIIDEVAGIKEYNEKKEKTLKELEKAQTKLNEYSIIMEEKRGYLQKLKREKEAALKYKELEENLDKNKACLAYTRVKAVEGTIENITKNLEIKENELKSINGKVDEFDDSFSETEKRIKDMEEEITKKAINRDLLKEIEEINNEILRKEGQINANRRELEAIDNMILKFEQINKRQIRNHAVKMVLDREGVYGTISTLSNVEPKYRIAFEISAGARLDDVVIDSESNTVKHIEYLKSNNIGRVRFLPLERIREFDHSAKAEIAAKMDGIIDLAINLVRFDRKYEKAFKHVFRDTLIAENVEAAKRIKGIRVVTLDGELFEAGGAIVGGSIKRKIVETAELREYGGEKENLENEIAQIKKEIGELNKKLDDKRKLDKNESSSVIKLQKEKDRLERQIEDMRSERKKKYERKINLEDELNNLRIRRAKLEGELENLMIDFENYKDREDLAKGDPSKLQTEIRDSERKLRGIGEVNLKSIEEYGNFNKEYGEFIEKFKKLQVERESIIKMIGKIDEKRKKLFLETFEALSKEFAKVYFDVSKGTAELELEEPNDIESGLLIKVQPKEKKLLSIDSLSGGEKVIAALSFLFAIQRYSPAPFYMLDEIDAALDKENSEKVGDLIKKYSEHAQFLMISHNDATVKKATRVYGVSMQKGTSQIIGVELEDN